jgi:cell fate regulator YaaT (PSP1 superfamily)
LLRHAAKEEVARMSVLEQEDREAHEICRSRAAHFRLQMKVIDAETQFDSNRVTFYFTADRRVDFRELVRDLARTFRTRIELRQIGARDAARRCDGIGPCGRRLCCTGFLTEFEPVTLKMAKQQNLALNPAKISGSCGRLMCCLTYEVRAYQEALRKAPLVGSAWRFRDAVWTVDRLDIGNHRLLLKDSEGCPEPVDLDEFRSQATPEAPSTEAADSAPNVGRTPPGKSLDGPSE